MVTKETSGRRNAAISESVSFSELSEWYFERIAPLTLKEHTRKNQESLIRNYVLPRIGTDRINEIMPVALDDLLYELRKSGGLKNARPLSEGTVKLIRMVLSGIFETAVRKQVLERNPVKSTTVPREEKKEREFPDGDLCRKLLFLLSGMKNRQNARALTVLLYTGMRRGELLALCWEDIDFEKEVIYIRHTLVRENGRSIRTTPKTESSCCMLALSEKLCAVFREQEEYVRKAAASAGTDGFSTRPCFVNRRGGFLNGEYLNSAFKKLLRENGMPSLHLHDLRHANASLLIHGGVPMKIVSVHLAHKSQHTTESFYIHICPDADRTAARCAERLLG